MIYGSNQAFPPNLVSGFNREYPYERKPNQKNGIIKNLVCCEVEVNNKMLPVLANAVVYNSF